MNARLLALLLLLAAVGALFWKHRSSKPVRAPWQAYSLATQPAPPPKPGQDAASAALQVLLADAVEGRHAAQLELARRYEAGIGLRHNRSEALRWYAKAAAQGNAEAQEALQRMQRAE